MFSAGFTTLSALLLFLYQSPSLSLCTVSSNIDEVLLINLFAVFLFGDFNVHQKDWLNYSGGTDRPRELCYNFSVSNDLTQMVNFPTRIPDCDSLLDLLLSSDTRNIGRKNGFLQRLSLH